MPIHIKKFYVGSYRGIKSLTLEKLNMINILTGNNNSGKTSILELLSTIDNPQDTGAWLSASRTSYGRLKKGTFFNGFSNMFSIDDEDKCIEYEFWNEDNIATRVKLKGELETTQILEKEMYRRNGLSVLKKKKDEEEIVDTTCLSLNTYIDDEEVNRDTIYDFQTRISAFVNKKPSFFRVNYISPVEHAKDISYLSDVLENPELYKQLLDILREFDENIINISAISNGTHLPEYVILSKNHKKAIPLNAYGDGMKKAILLISAIVHSQNGVLLIDEFETAIHTSAMNSLFQWLFQSALKLNVQIFLTSHSKEAIDKVLKLDENLQKNINLYTLYRYEDKNYVRRLVCEEAINAQDNLGLELR